MGVKLNTASGGSVSIEPTNTASNYTLTVPAQTGTVIASDSSGNVGIGTSSPDSSNKLQVTGDIGLTWATDKFIGMKFGSGGSYKMGLMLKDSTRECKVWSQSSDSDDKITFYTGSTPTERGRFTSAGDFQFNSGYGSVATAYGCRAWVNFNGTGTVAIRASGNVSSITDNGTGDYTINFTNAMPDADYSCNVTGSNSGSADVIAGFGDRGFTTTTTRITCRNFSGGRVDSLEVMFAVFR